MNPKSKTNDKIELTVPLNTRVPRKSRNKRHCPRAPKYRSCFTGRITEHHKDHWTSTTKLYHQPIPRPLPNGIHYHRSQWPRSLRCKRKTYHQPRLGTVKEWNLLKSLTSITSANTTTRQKSKIRREMKVKERNVCRASLRTEMERGRSTTRE